MTPLAELQLRQIDGRTVSLKDYIGNVLLIVNVASKCGLTPQYAVLETLFETYRDRGFLVLGFPANDFMAQEPGSNEEIAQFCTSTFGVTFPMFEKIAVTGAAQHPLYACLVAAKPTAESTDGGAFEAKLREHGIVGAPAAVRWNFEKFLLDRQGRVVARFAPSVLPDSPELVSAIERELDPRPTTAS